MGDAVVRRAVIAALGVAVAVLLVAFFTRDFASQTEVERNLHEYLGDLREAVGPFLSSPLFLAAAALFAATQVVWWTRSTRPPPERTRRVVLHAVLLLYGAAVLAVTTFPITFVGWSWAQLEYLLPGRGLADLLRRVADGSGLTSVVKDILGNVVAFVPAGVLLPLGWPRFRRLRSTLFTVAVFTGSVEGLQLFTDAIPNFDDVLLNIVGAAIGYGTYRAGQALLTPADQGVMVTRKATGRSSSGPLDH